MKKIILFRKALNQEGGAERLMLETASRAKNFGFESHVVVLTGGDTAKLFNGLFSHIQVETLHSSDYPSGLYSKIAISFLAIIKLRSLIRRINPDCILAHGSDDVEMLYFATIFTGYAYSTFIFWSLFRLAGDPIKYLFPFRKVFPEIRNFVWGHKDFIPEQAPPLGLLARIIAQSRAIVDYFAVRKARSIFVPSNQMGWEVGKLYGKEFIVIKTGIDKKMFDYSARQDMKQKLGIEGKTMILEVSRLDPQKRMDLAISAFGEIARDFPDALFVIGGRGPDRVRLEELIDKLNLKNRVILAGFIPEGDLFDLYASCDLVLHPAWVDFDISFMEPLALGKKIVCSTEYDLMDNLLKLKGELIFPANPTVKEMSQSLKIALSHQPQLVDSLKNLLFEYTWDDYTQKLFAHLKNDNRR